MSYKTVNGTAGKISTTEVNGILDVSIDPTYIGQTSITTLGTLVSLTVSGGQISNLTEVATTYNVLSTDYVVGVTNTSAARNVFLPTPSAGNKGQIFIVKDESGAAATHHITVKVTGGAFIDGAANSVISTNYGSGMFYCNGTQYYNI